LLCANVLSNGSVVPVSPIADNRQAQYTAAGYRSDALLAFQTVRSEREAPDAPALADETRSLTRRELNAEVERFAHHYQCAGIGVGDIVCIQGPNQAGIVAAIMACWHIGAVALPIVSIYREAELRAVLEDLPPAAVVSVTEHRGRDYASVFDDLLAELRISPRTRVLLSGQRAGWVSAAGMQSPPGRLAPVITSPDNPCLILLTSGTTGRSKAVVHSSRTLLAEAVQMARAWRWTAADIAYIPVPLAHISGLLKGIIVPSFAGSPVVLRKRWETDRVVEDLRATQASFLSVPGLLLAELITAYEASGCPPHGLEVMTVGVADGQYAAFEAAEGYGMGPARTYGMSELPTITITAPGQGLAERMRSCGPAAAGVELSVRDESGACLPEGELGELYVRGPEQMLGYLDPAANRAVWTDDGWLRSGDVATVRGGLVNLFGRTKDIINRGGEKFSSLEIERYIAAHDGVAAVAVVAGRDARLGETPVAFVVRTEAAPAVTGEQLAAFMQGSGLARQKIPSAWRFVGELPMTASGKVRKEQLRLQLDS
jgi:acyl-CoA synthetase (AMP-forming)/AMP-acid ligase II